MGKNKILYNMRNTKYGYETFWAGVFNCLSTTGLCLTGFMVGINLLFFSFSYHFLPLTHIKVFLNIIQCNIKTIGFLFGMGILGAMWGKLGQNFNYVPKEVLIWMTVTFAVITLYNIFIK